MNEIPQIGAFPASNTTPIVAIVYPNASGVYNILLLPAHTHAQVVCVCVCVVKESDDS